VLEPLNYDTYNVNCFELEQKVSIDRDKEVEMSLGVRVMWGMLVVLVIAGALAWINRSEILLKGIEIAAARRMEIGPPRSIAWDSGVDPRGRAAADRPPNIVLILADDLGWNDLTFDGGGVAGGTVPTPNIDSLAADGVHFRNGYAANGTCAPSRAAIMSGRYGTRFGFEFTPTPPGMGLALRVVSSQMPGRLRDPITNPDFEPVSYEQMGMPSTEITIAQLLKEQDYHTVHIGKWHLGRANGMAPEDQGFDESLLMASGLYLPKDDPDVVNSMQDFDPIDKFLWRALRFAASFNGGDAFEPAGYLTDYYTDEAVKVIEQNKDRPFFLYLAHWAPHTPLQATQADYDALGHIKLHRERVYAAMIRALDRGVGQVLDALRANGLEDNTLVIFTSDNGPWLSYGNRGGSCRPLREGKGTTGEGGVREPCIMRWPGKIPAGGSCSEVAGTIDILPTIANIIGAKLPDHRIDGRNILPLMRGEKDARSPHDAFYYYLGHNLIAVRSGKWKLVYPHTYGQPEPGSGGLPGKRRKAKIELSLFDLQADRGETTNLIEKHPKISKRLEALAEQARNDLGDARTNRKGTNLRPVGRL